MGAPFCAYKPLIINEIIFKINENKFGNVDYYFDLYYVIRDKRYEKRDIFRRNWMGLRDCEIPFE
jgi:hypothetical protein